LATQRNSLVPPCAPAKIVADHPRHGREDLPQPPALLLDLRGQPGLFLLGAHVIGDVAEDRDHELDLPALAEDRRRLDYRPALLAGRAHAEAYGAGSGPLSLECEPARHGAERQRLAKFVQQIEFLQHLPYWRLQQRLRRGIAGDVRGRIVGIDQLPARILCGDPVGDAA
jgi:hypothetical protein